MKAEFLANPQGSYYTYENQLFPSLEVIELSVEDGAIFTRAWANDNLPFGTFEITFSNLIPPSSFDGEFGNAKLYRNGVFIEEVGIWQQGNQVISFDFATSFTPTDNPLNGNYSIVVPQITDVFGQVFEGIAYGGWNFTVADGDFNSGDFNGTDFFIN